MNFISNEDDEKQKFTKRTPRNIQFTEIYSLQKSHFLTGHLTRLRYDLKTPLRNLPVYFKEE